MIICYNEMGDWHKEISADREDREDLLYLYLRYFTCTLGTMDGGLIEKALFWGVYEGGR